MVGTTFGKKMKSALFVLLLFLWLPAANAWAVDGSKCRHVVRAAPIFFVTDRAQRTGKGSLAFGAQVTDPLDRITYGVVDLPSVDTGKSARLDATHLPAERIYSEFRELASDLRRAADGSARGEVVIFVHGCCISFREAVRQSRQLRNQVERPVILYDWGSPSASYSGSLLACPRSQERFNLFMEALTREFPRERVVIVGLSMGNILIDNYFMQHHADETGTTFDQVVFARADMDLIAFKSHLPKIVAHARRIFIYADKHDLMINLSQLVRTLAAPVVHGERVGRLSSSLQSVQEVTVVDVSPLRLNHDLPSGVLSDLLASGGALPGKGQYQYVQLPNGILRAQPK